MGLLIKSLTTHHYRYPSDCNQALDKRRTSIKHTPNKVLNKFVAPAIVTRNVKASQWLGSWVHYKIS